MEKQCVLSILVHNQPGVLSRIAGLFSGRGYNIDSISVAETMDKDISRITLITTGEKNIIEQITKQLNKLINVVRVCDFTNENYIYRELALIKVNAKAEARAEILRIADIFRCHIVDVGTDHYILEITASKNKLQAIIDLLKPFGIKDFVKTGSIALQRGK